MIDTEHVKCDTCTAPEPMELDASDEASRGWPTVDIETNPYKAQFPLFQQHPEIAFLDSAATAQRPACVAHAGLQPPHLHDLCLPAFAGAGERV